MIRIVLDGQTSKNYPINASEPQGSILGTILFVVFINDLPENTFRQLVINAEDRTVYSCLVKTNELFEKVEFASELEEDLRTVTEWVKRWLVSSNSCKTKLIDGRMCIGLPYWWTEWTALGIVIYVCWAFHSPMTFHGNEYIETFVKSMAMKVSSLYGSRKFLSSLSILYLYKSAIQPFMEYCCHIWGGFPNSSLRLLDRIKKRIMNLLGLKYFKPTTAIISLP